MNNSKLIRKRIGVDEIDTVKYRRKELDDPQKDIRLLDRARTAWENLREVREQRARACRFTWGDQWADPITTIVDGEKKTITMREYLALEGHIPMQTNQIKSQVSTILGVLVKEQNEPVCNALDRDEQQYGELLTMGLQANYNKNRMNSLYSKCATDFILGGMAFLYEEYGYRDNDKRREDSWTKYIDPDYIILETSLRDPRFWDMSMIGCWYRMPFRTLAAKFVKKKSDYDTLRRIYASQSSTFNEMDYQDITEEADLNNLDFMRPIKNNECCVAEIWTLETKERVRAIDTNVADAIDVYDADDHEMLRTINETNRQRKALAKSAGWSEEEVPLIELEYFIDTFWYCKILTPDGTVLFEEESTLPDRLHPFTIMVTPFTNGRICGYMQDGIDHQIAINRAVVLQDWIVRNQIKGFTMIPMQLVPDNMTNEEFVKTGINMGNYFFYNADKARGLKPEVFHAGAVSYDAGNYITQLKSLMESSTAISGAIQGKTPYSGTSAALYAQQTANSSTPIAALLSDVRAFMEESAIKKAKNIAANYDAGRWKSIAGSMSDIFGNANMNLNDVADIEFDVAIKESTETPMYQAITNDQLLAFLQMGAIDLPTMLECGRFPFGDKLLQKIQARQAEMEAAQQGQMGGVAQDVVEKMQESLPQTEGYGLPVKSTREIVE